MITRPSFGQRKVLFDGIMGPGQEVDRCIEGEPALGNGNILDT